MKGRELEARQGWTWCHVTSFHKRAIPLVSLLVSPLSLANRVTHIYPECPSPGWLWFVHTIVNGALSWPRAIVKRRPSATCPPPLVWRDRLASTIPKFASSWRITRPWIKLRRIAGHTESGLPFDLFLNEDIIHRVTDNLNFTRNLKKKMPAHDFKLYSVLSLSYLSPLHVGFHSIAA